VDKNKKSLTARILKQEREFMDDRIKKLIDATHQLKEGNFQVDLPTQPLDDVGHLGKALQELAATLELRYQEIQKLNQITTRINSGFLLNPILEAVYRDFCNLIPYNRIGFSLLEDNGQILRARWAKSDQQDLKLKVGYSAPMAGSSLQGILTSGQPRILNNLPEYLARKPESESTALIVSEGYRSSLTCPLVAGGVAVGFMFFSSCEINTYDSIHVSIFEQIAEQLSVIVEKGRLVSELADKSVQIERQNEELQRLNYLKNFFVGMAAHDLRNPVANIQLTSDLLLDDLGGPLSPEELRGFVRDINQQARFMTELINDILGVAEIEGGKLTLNPSEFALGSFLSDAVRRARKLAEPKQIQVVLEGDPVGKLRGDPQRLRQVLDNLLSNAIKFSPSGSTVRVHALQQPGTWRIEIEDQGPGIQEKDRPRLFQDFAKLSARPTGGEKSTGLGLAIARRIIDTHGGQIGVDSKPGQGAVFWFVVSGV
jgi:signal transduction histidine kinase